MYYRYEVRIHGDSKWRGAVVTLFDLNEEIRIGFQVPVWLQKNADKYYTKSWFTEQGYKKFHERVEKLLLSNQLIKDHCQVRLLKTKKLDNVVYRGRWEAIQKLGDVAQENE